MSIRKGFDKKNSKACIIVGGGSSCPKAPRGQSGEEQ
jgi:hypothetical protein